MFEEMLSDFSLGIRRNRLPNAVSLRANGGISEVSREITLVPFMARIPSWPPFNNTFIMDRGWIVGRAGGVGTFWLSCRSNIATSFLNVDDHFNVSLLKKIRFQIIFSIETRISSELACRKLRIVGIDENEKMFIKISNGRCKIVSVRRQDEEGDEEV